MFGYIKPDLPNLYMKDDTLYKALYCGVCKSIGGTCGQVARMSLTYDVAFLSAVAHNLVNKDVVIKRSHCVLHPVTKRPIAKRDELTDMLASVNVILAYRKLLDDVYDNGKGRLRSGFLKGAYKRAKKKHPNVDEIVERNYKELFDCERRGVDSVDIASDAFSKMLSELSDYVFGKYATEYTARLFYNVGKWIYLIDALDDYDKDLKKKNYNVFRLRYNAADCRELLKENGEDVLFYFKIIFSQIAECLNNVRFFFNADLVANILLKGLPKATDELIRKVLKDA